ncbi:hypothetical protein [Humisphaera borealis]|uniref:Uncharacterized protein n=1 Tax=Humisphaera borealis TaxID=2807512 RepID=A0A7M2WXY2_9BACT|nr:hypothetical protein [Humisphaera borealis]QOV90082.1 hypothetical protein IPV69_01540 [Humisphaera borealis]
MTSVWTKPLPRAGLPAIILIVFVIFLGCLGVTEPIDVGIPIFVGWWRYVSRTLPKVRIDGFSLASALVWVGLFAIGLHFFCGWLYRSLVREVDRPDVPPRDWRTRWTAMLVGLVVFLFAAGTAAVCVVHQIGFLATGSEPMFAIHDNNANLDTEGLKAFVERGSHESANEIYERATLSMAYHKPFLDRHHLFAWDGPGGTRGGVIVFHRDPLLRAEHGIVVFSNNRAVVRSADELSKVLQLIPAP